MEVPILLACDTTEGWEKGDTALGESELAIEIAGEKEDGSLVKHLLIGDGKPAGPNAKRLRATIDLIAGMREELEKLQAAIDAEALERIQGDKELDEKISAEERERIKAINELAKTAFAAINAEAQERIQRDKELAAVISAETEARKQRDKELTEADQAIADDITSLSSRLDAYNAAIEYLVLFIESKLGPLGGAFPLIVEGGFYLVTEADDYLVTA
jgi:hypothetical protein